MKCIVSDLDGTLLSTHKHISKGNLEALNEARNRGIEVMFATGREYQSVRQIMDHYGLDAEVILMNGAQHRDNKGNIIRSIGLLPHAWQAVIALARQYDIGALIYFEDVTYAFTGLVDLKTRMIRRFASFIQRDPSLVRQLVNEGFWLKLPLLPDYDAIASIPQQILKIEFFDFPEGQFEEMLQALDRIPDLSIVPYGTHSMEITSHYAQKGIMLEEVMALKGYDKEDVMVIGDGLNDISMFERFPHSVAMGNAIDIVKDKAHHCTLTNEEDGVAYAIRNIAFTKR